MDFSTEQRLHAAVKGVLDAESELTDLCADIVTDDTADLLNEALADLAVASDKLGEFVKARIEQEVRFIKDGGTAAPAPDFVEMTEGDARRLDGMEAAE